MNGCTKIVSSRGVRLRSTCGTADFGTVSHAASSTGFRFSREATDMAVQKITADGHPRDRPRRVDGTILVDITPEEAARLVSDVFVPRLPSTARRSES